MKRDKYKSMKIWTIIIVYITLALLSIWQLLLKYGPIGYRHDWGYPQYAYMISSQIYKMFYAWQEDNFGMELPYASPYLYVLITCTPALYGAGGVFMTKFLVFSFIFGSALFMFFLSKHYFKKLGSAFLSGLLYSLNPLVFNKIVAGHVTYLFSYMLAPLLFLAFLKSKNEKKYIFGAALLCPLVFTQLQFIIMIPCLLIFYSLFMKDKTLITNSLFIISIGFLVHSPWILPKILNIQETTSYIQTGTSVDVIARRSPPIIAVPFLLGTTYFVDAVWGVGLIPFLTGGITILLLLLLNIKSKKKFVWFFIMLAIIGLFLSKGANPPFGELFLKIPFIGIFREVHHLLFIPAFAYAVLFGSSYELFKNKKLLPLFVLAIVLFSYPLLSGNFMNQVQIYEWDKSYGEIMLSLNNDPNNYRVLYLPMNQPMHPKNLKYPGVDPMITTSPKPSLNQYISLETDPNRITAYLSNLINYESPNNLQDLLRILNIKYIISRDDFSSKFWNYSYMQYFPTISSQYSKSKTEYIKKLLPEVSITNKQYSNVHIFEVPNYSPIIYAADKSILTSSNLDILTNYDSLNSSKPAIFFASQANTQLIEIVDDIIASDPLDIQLINATKYKPSDFVTNSNASAGWARFFDYSFGWWWYNPKYSSHIDSSILTLVPNSTLKVPISTTGTLYIKSLGPILIKIDNATFSINSSSISWHKIANISSEKFIEFISQGEAAISSIAIATSLIHPSMDYAFTPDKYDVPFQNKIPNILTSSYGVYGCEINCRPNILINNNTWRFDVHFYQNESVDEYFLLRIPIDFNISNFPILKFEFMLEDKSIQTLQFGLHFKNTSKILASDPLSYTTGYSTITINISEYANLLNKSLNDIDAIYFYLHKWWIVDAPNNFYSFWIRNATFYPKELLLNHYYKKTNIKNDIYNISLSVSGTGLINISLNNQNRSIFINSSKPAIISLGEFNISSLEFNATTYAKIHNIILTKHKEESTKQYGPHISFSKLNPTNYIVNVNSSKPFFLVFSSSYDSAWIAESDRTTFEHYKVNGFANTYYINKTGNFTVSIIYKKQETYYTHIILSLFTLLILLIIFLHKEIIQTIIITKIIFKIFTLYILIWLCSKNKRLNIYKLKFKKSFNNQEKMIIKEFEKSKIFLYYKRILSIKHLEKWCLTIALIIVYIHLIPLGAIFVIKSFKLRYFTNYTLFIAYMLLIIGTLIKSAKFKNKR